MKTCKTCGKTLTRLQEIVSDLFCGFPCAQDAYLILEREADKREDRLNRIRLQQAEQLKELYHEIHNLRLLTKE